MTNNTQGNKGQYRPGENHPNWKGGRYLDADGYVRVLVGPGEYKLEHIIVMESHLGRPIKQDEIVHHKNGVRDCNVIDNLELMERGDHGRHHNTGLKRSDETKALLCSMREGTNSKENHPQWKAGVNKESILAAISQHKKLRGAAAALGIHPDTLRARMKHYSIKKGSGRE